MRNTIKFNCEEIMAAVEKVALANGKHFVFELKTKADGKDEDKNIMSITSSDGAVQAQAHLYVTVQEDVSEKTVFVLDATIANTLRTLVHGVEEMEMDITDNMAVIRNGLAVIPMPIVETNQAVSIKEFNPKTQACFGMEIKNEDMKKAVSRVMCACTTTDSDAQFANSLLLLPYGNLQEPLVRLITVDGNGTMASRAVCEVSAAKGALFEEMAKAESVLCCPASFLSKVVRQLNGETSKWFVSANQIVIRQGSTLFVITLRSFNINLKKISELLFEETVDEYSLQTSITEITSALEVATLNMQGDDANRVVLEASSDGVILTSYNGKNKVSLPNAKITGSIRIGLSKKKLLQALSKCSEPVTLHGAGETSFVYIADECKEANTFMLPVRLAKQEESLSKTENTGNEE